MSSHRTQIISTDARRTISRIYSMLLRNSAGERISKYGIMPATDNKSSSPVTVYPLLQPWHSEEYGDLKDL